MHTREHLLYLCLLLVCIPLCYSLASDRAHKSPETYAASRFIIPPSLQFQLQGYQRKWTRLTELEPSGLHWNQNILLYINKNVNIYHNNYIQYQRLMSDHGDSDDSNQNREEFQKYAPGTIILKENYEKHDQPFSKPSSITLMMKQNKGYDPEMGDWRFVQFDKEGSIVVDGNSQEPTVKMMCTFCHHEMADRDYVFSTMYALPQEG